jgi:hypothetical protein
MPRPAAGARFVAVLGLLGGMSLWQPGLARAEDGVPPWSSPLVDVPLPDGVRSVVPQRPEVAIYSAPNSVADRRGSAQLGVRFGFFGSARGNGCSGRWLLIGPAAWVCSDVAMPNFDEAAPPAWAPHDDGLPFRYFFAGANGASGYANPSQEGEAASDQELEQGFSVAVVEERAIHGKRWGRTPQGRWFALQDLVPARPFLFRGATIANKTLDMAWVKIERASVFASPKADKAAASRVRFEKVHVLEERGTGANTMLRIEPDAKDPKGEVWIRARDVARPSLAAPPEGAQDGERWIDVELSQQTLVAYEGKTPVFATVVSTGKGPPASDLGTHLGTHRIWVKILSTKMGNLEKEDQNHYYYIEDVPYVQFFDKAIALHGAYWHRDFGHVHSHGCVNLAPIDAEWLFQFTGPHMPRGWKAIFPRPSEPGSLVRVRP